MLCVPEQGTHLRFWVSFLCHLQLSCCVLLPSNHTGSSAQMLALLLELPPFLPSELACLSYLSPDLGSSSSQHLPLICWQIT